MQQHPVVVCSVFFFFFECYRWGCGGWTGHSGVFATLSPFRAISFSLQGCQLGKSIPNAPELRVLDTER